MTAATAIRQQTESTTGTNTPKSILILGRSNDDQDGADTGYILLSITREGLENLKKIGSKIDDFAEIVGGVGGEFSSTQIYTPAGVNAFVVTDTDDEPLEVLVGGEKGMKAVFSLGEGEEVDLEILDRLSDEKPLVRLTPVDEDSLLQMSISNEPNFSIDSHLLRFYAGDAFYLYCMFKYCDGGYALDSISVEQLESYFQDEPATAAQTEIAAV